MYQLQGEKWFLQELVYKRDDLAHIIRALSVVDGWQKKRDGRYHWETYPFTFILSIQSDKKNLPSTLTLTCEVKGETVFQWLYNGLTGLVLTELHPEYRDWYRLTLEQEAENGLFDKAMKAIQETFEPQLDRQLNLVDRNVRTKNQEELKRLLSFFSSQEEIGAHVQKWEKNFHIYQLETESCLSYKVVDTHFKIQFGLAMNKDTQEYNVIIDHLRHSSESAELFLLDLIEKKMAQIEKGEKSLIPLFENLHSLILETMKEKEWLDEEECFLFETTFPNDLKALKVLLANESFTSATEQYTWLQRIEDAIQQAVEETNQRIAHRKNKALEKQVRVIEERTTRMILTH